MNASFPIKASFIPLNCLSLLWVSTVLIYIFINIKTAYVIFSTTSPWVRSPQHLKVGTSKRERITLPQTCSYLSVLWLIHGVISHALNQTRKILGSCSTSSPSTLAPPNQSFIPWLLLPRESPSPLLPCILVNTARASEWAGKWQCAHVAFGN